ncbi:MAG TPA: cellulase family glycosylhydrolase [Bacteroidota bacterium]|nr:cellulase family glycosylhydrolase [Bacteroidota bacterium]
MKLSLRGIASALLFSALVWSTACAEGFLHASGTSIVNDKGETVLLRGMGLGGWHVQEGYMFGMPSSTMNAAYQIRNRIVEVVGAANADSFYHTFTANFVTRRDMERLSQLGFNSVRMPMHCERFFSTSSPDGWNEQGFVEMDSLLRWCGDNKMYLILDLHAAPGGQSHDNISDYNPSYPSLWESEENKTLTVNLWKKLAERYANEPWIGGYDLLNETHWTLGTNVLRDMMVRITTAIRTVDTKHIVFIEGNDYANNFAGLTPPWDNNMVYSFHKYWSTNDQASISGFITMSKKYNVPLWCGESGENSNAWFTDAIRLLENNGIGWSWWTLKKFDTVVGPFSVPNTPQYTALLNYWNGSAAKPSVTAALSGLLGMAEGLKLDKCVYHPDVIDAMMRLPFDNTRRAFAANAVPGKIYAANYDLGTHNLAYRDADYQATSGTWSSYNSGGFYRNDGVDIEKCSDLPTIGYDVGWTAANEFLTYTVSVQKTGKYTVSLRAAVNDAGSIVATGWDDGVLEQKALAQTGGWTSWTTQAAGSVDLTAGTHSLKVFCFTGGFNLHYLDIAYAGPTSVKPSKTLPAEFSLSQNFPNPFNPSSLIRFSVKVSGPVRLTVSDVLGREIAVLVNERLEAGAYERTFTPRQASASGLYFYTLTSGGQTITRSMVFSK